MSVWGDRTPRKSPTAARTALCYVVMRVGSTSSVTRRSKTKGQGKRECLFTIFSNKVLRIKPQGS